MTALISKLTITTLFTLSTSGMAELWFGCFEYYHAYRSGNTFNAYVWCWSKICGATKYQLPTPYSFRDLARTTFYRSRSLRQGQRSNQGHTMTLHTYTP